jgi:hypothetical protein
MIRKSGNRFSEKIMRKQKPLAGVTRLHLSQPRDAPPIPVIVPGADARIRPRAEVTSLRPRAPHSLRQPVSPAGVLHGSEIFGYVTEKETTIEITSPLP